MSDESIQQVVEVGVQVIARVRSYADQFMAAYIAAVVESVEDMYGIHGPDTSRR